MMTFKDKLPDAMRFGIVYLRNCPNYQVGLFGLLITNAQKKIGYCQQAGIRDRAGRDVKDQKTTSIYQSAHTLVPNKVIDIEYFKTLDSCPNQKVLRMLESVYTVFAKSNPNQAKPVIFPFMRSSVCVCVCVCVCVHL